MLDVGTFRFICPLGAMSNLFWRRKEDLKYRFKISSVYPTNKQIKTRTVSDLTEWYPSLAILWCSNFGIQVYKQVTYEKWTDMELCQGDNIPSPK